MQPADIFARLTGRWAGTVRTWFEPGVLADESAVEGEFSPLLGDRLMRHAYRGAMQGKPRAGEETIAFNKNGPRWEVAWVDDFHMGRAILWSLGESTDRGFSVLGHYLLGDPHPPWGWRTEYAFDGADRLTITAYNIMPGEAEAKAVETVYQRVRP